MLQPVLKSAFRLTFFIALCSLVSCQCDNTLAVYNPNLRTECVNGTYFIVPVNITLVEDAVSPYKLLPLPTSDNTIFPTGFPSGYYPVLVSISYGSDIRMIAVLSLQITSLNQGSIVVPNVDFLGDGKSPFLYNMRSYIGGTDGKPLTPVVPATVGTLEGTTIFPSVFDPYTAPYRQIGDGSEYIAQIKDTVIPNDVSGPGVTYEAVDTDFFTADSSSYTAHTFHYFINQPLIQNNKLMCQRNPLYFNQTFTNPIFRVGTVTTYSNPASVFPNVYKGVAGYSASGVQVGYNAESCQAAHDNYDPTAQA